MVVNSKPINNKTMGIFLVESEDGSSLTLSSKEVR